MEVPGPSTFWRTGPIHKDTAHSMRSVLQNRRSPVPSIKLGSGARHELPPSGVGSHLPGFAHHHPHTGMILMIASAFDLDGPAIQEQALVGIEPYRANPEVSRTSRDSIHW